MKRLSLAVAMVLVLSSFAGAAALVEWSLDGAPHTPPPETWPASFAVEGVTPFDLSRGPGIRAMSLTNGFSADEWDDAVSRDAALNIGAYFQFGFKVDEGKTVSLSTLDFALRRSARTAPYNIEVQVSLDGFATPGIVVASLNYFGRTSGTAPWPDPTQNDPYYYMHSDLPGRPNETTSPGDPVPTIDLTAISALQNIPGGTEVTFRIYAWGDSSTTNTNTLALGRMIGPLIGGTIQ